MKSGYSWMLRTMSMGISTSRTLPLEALPIVGHLSVGLIDCRVRDLGIR
jgi:hypothetical protein